MNTLTAIRKAFLGIDSFGSVIRILIGGRGKPGSKGEQQYATEDGNACFFASCVHDGKYSFFHAFFTSVKISCQCGFQIRLVSDHAYDCFAVMEPRIGIRPVHHFGIAGYFTLYVNGFCNQIHKRIEPVNGGCEQYEAFVPQILTLIVDKLMIKDKAKLICGKMYVGEKYPLS